MSWLDRILPPRIQSTSTSHKKNIPEGLWNKCPACESVLYRADLQENLNVCPKCAHHHRISARERLDQLLDQQGRTPVATQVMPKDPLRFKDSKRYSDRLSHMAKETHESDALIVIQGSIEKVGLVVACFNFDFMGGSMGSVVGERFLRGIKQAVQEQVPFLCITASGGARMQEGLFSLMQMAKTSAAISLLSEQRLPFLTLLTDPTMGGVSASFAFISDVVMAEPRALIGFAGPRVIEQTVRETLPEGFQRAEYLLEKGAIDMIVDRREQRQRIVDLLTLLQDQPTEKVNPLKASPSPT